MLVGGPGRDRPQTELHRRPYHSSSSQIETRQEDTACSSMLIMTGPNYSGKSVYLKQVAVIVYMAHIGRYCFSLYDDCSLSLLLNSFVPADRAIIGITDKILTRISTKESVSKIQSAFMIDIQQISLALSLATNKSLLVIDEFGKGTEANGVSSRKYCFVKAEKYFQMVPA
jgi:DNA mismatch repair protein MSH5